MCLYCIVNVLGPYLDALIIGQKSWIILCILNESILKKVFQTFITKKNKTKKANNNPCQSQESKHGPPIARHPPGFCDHFPRHIDRRPQTMDSVLTIKSKTTGCMYICMIILKSLRYMFSLIS